MVGFLQFAAARDVLLIIVRVRHALQIAADDRGRLIVLGDGHGVKSLRPVGHVNVTAHEIQQIRALQQSLAIQALLSLRSEMWQSSQALVSFARTVCGTNVLNAVPLKPSAETVCCV